MMVITRDGHAATRQARQDKMAAVVVYGKGGRNMVRKEGGREEVVVIGEGETFRAIGVRQLWSGLLQPGEDRQRQDRGKVT